MSPLYPTSIGSPARKLLIPLEEIEIRAWEHYLLCNLVVDLGAAGLKSLIVGLAVGRGSV